LAESSIGPAHAGTPPSEDELASTIARLFAQEFKIPHVDMDAHFLFLGGDSLNAESLMTAISSHFSLKLQTATLLDAPTPRELARVVARMLASRPGESR
jgi:acyl carrier protein